MAEAPVTRCWFTGAALATIPLMPSAAQNARTAIGRLVAPRKAGIGRLTITNCPIAIADLQIFDI